VWSAMSRPGVRPAAESRERPRAAQALQQPPRLGRQNEVCGSHCDVTAAQPYGDADICFPQRWGVVDSVAGHCDYVPRSRNTRAIRSFWPGVTRATTAPSSLSKQAARSSSCDLDVSPATGG
jgi:hypothetical protein